MNWTRVQGAVSHVIGMRSWCGGTKVRNALVDPQANLSQDRVKMSQIREIRKYSLLV